MGGRRDVHCGHSSASDAEIWRESGTLDLVLADAQQAAPELVSYLLLPGLPGLT